MQRLLVCEMTNVVIQAYGGNIPDDEIFRLWNNECCYTDVWGHNISDAGLLVCEMTNIVITSSL